MNESPATEPTAEALRITTLEGELAGVREELEAMRARKDAAYAERTKVVAAYARLAVACGCVAGTAVHDLEADPSWSPEWRFIVYIDLPTGQVSWHFQQDAVALFTWLPPYEKPWDGHSTPEKYNRLAAFNPASVLFERLHAAKAALEARVAPLREAHQQALADIVTSQAARSANLAKTQSQQSAEYERQSNGAINELVNTFTNHETQLNDAVNEAIEETLG